MKKFMLGIILCSCFFIHAQDINILWEYKSGVIRKIFSKELFSACSQKESFLLYPLTFSFDITKKVKTIPLFSHSHLKIIGIKQLKIQSKHTNETLNLRFLLKEKKLICLLEKISGFPKNKLLMITANIYYVDKKTISRPKRASGNCFKCSGKGKLGTWCNFCHGFMASCIHGCSWRSCNACSGIGWIETHYQRCARCNGKAWVGTWCNFCHGFMQWCRHTRWRDCSTCRGKGALTSEYSRCSKCNGKGWVGTWCNFCHGNMMWCRHISSPRTCPQCQGKGVTK